VPLHPGHELAGIVTAVGANVKKLAVVGRCKLRPVVESAWSLRLKLK